jgi:hypothetical protein
METNIPSLTQELFTPLSTLPILICYKCQSAVRISQVIAHLISSSHSLSARTASQIQEYLPTFTPNSIPNCPLPFPHLPLYHDGIQCQFTPTCHYVCRTTKVMKEHWRTSHQWLAQAISTASTQQLLENCTHSVSCQRLYRRGPTSHYFAVLNPVRSESAEPESASSTIDQLFDQLEKQHQEIFQPIPWG